MTAANASGTAAAQPRLQGVGVLGGVLLVIDIEHGLRGLNATTLVLGRKLGRLALLSRRAKTGSSFRSCSDPLKSILRNILS